MRGRLQGKAAIETLSTYTASMDGVQGIRSNVVSPEDVARVVAYLASDDATYVSGQVVKVDGGGARGLRW